MLIHMDSTRPTAAPNEPGAEARHGQAGLTPRVLSPLTLIRAGGHANLRHHHPSLNVRKSILAPIARRNDDLCARAEVHITAATMGGWLDPTHELCRLIVDSMLGEAMTVRYFIGADATGVLVQAQQAMQGGPLLGPGSRS